MESIPAKVDRSIMNFFQRLGNRRLVLFYGLLMVVSLGGSLLWAAAAMGSSRQFRLLMLITPLLVSYLIHVNAREKSAYGLVVSGWMFFVISFLLGKFIIFSHFMTALPLWLSAFKYSDFVAAILYLPYLFNATQFKLFVNGFSAVADYADVIWMAAGFYLIWRHQIFSGKPLNKKDKDADNRRLFNRRFNR